MRGYGIPDSPYSNMVIDLIGPRTILLPEGYRSIEQTTTGIMMGEAIAKPSLTILNLAVEELAYLTYKNRLDLLGTHLPSPYSSWRYIHIGGDDHLAVGPPTYLDEITNKHISAGSHIDPGKHGRSNICVKYTERCINVCNIPIGKPIHEDYEKSIIIDSIKVRLLERGQSTMLKKDNKNVAIGKSAQLGTALEWLPKSEEFWPEDKKDSIRSLFIERMGPLLPRKAVNPKAFWAIHLPRILGGYGLGEKSKIKYYLDNSPLPTQWLLEKALEGNDITEDLKIFRKLNSNISSRGIESIQKLKEDISGQIKEDPSLHGAVDWKFISEQFPDDNPRRTLAIARNSNWMSVEDFADYSTRGTLFETLLTGSEPQKQFNTRRFVDTYRKVWGQAEQRDLDIYRYQKDLWTNRDITNAISPYSKLLFIDISQKTAIDVGEIGPNGEDLTYDFRECSLLEMFTIGTPSLNIGWKFLFQNYRSGANETQSGP
jgi:hypothetical protein